MRKKYIIIITIFLVVLVPVLFVIILVSTIFNNEKNYYRKANWNVTRDEFYDEYYPSIKKYFNNYLSDYEINYYEKIDSNKYLYEMSFDNCSFKIRIKIEVFDDLCVFQSDVYYLYDTTAFKYDDIEFIDKLLTQFGKIAFYDYQITDGVIYDIFDENINEASYNYYYDSAVGNLGCGWCFREGKNYNFNESPYVFYMGLKTFFRDSDSFLNRIS